MRSGRLARKTIKEAITRGLKTRLYNQLNETHSPVVLIDGGPIYNSLKALLLTACLMAAGSLNAATVDLNGRTYQTGDFYKRSVRLDMAAKLGESTTFSYAIEVGLDFDNLFNNALATGKGNFVELYPNSVSLYERDHRNSAFSFASGFPRSVTTSDGRHYAAFDLIFAPTAETMTSDYEVSNSDPNAPRVFRADVYTEYSYDSYSVLGSDTPETRQYADYLFDEIGVIWGYFTYKNYIVAFNNGNNAPGPRFEIYATVLPGTTPVTPVPVPGSLAMLALGLMGLGALKRRNA